MNAFRFNFGDDDEGFEVIEEGETVEELENEDEEATQIDDDVIWEIEED